VIHGTVLRAQSGNGGLKLDTGKEIYMRDVSPATAGRERSAANLGCFQQPSHSRISLTVQAPLRSQTYSGALLSRRCPEGFSQIMPSFKDMLTQDQISKVIEYLRSLCPVKPGPGNLNLRAP